MKTTKTIVCGFLAVIFVLAFTACSGSNSSQGQKLTGTDSFRFSVINNGTAYSVSAGTATEGTVNIPASYRPNAESDYLPVTAIEGGGFRGHKNIIKIIIPKGITAIGNEAFQDCTNLTSITIPDSVTSIGDYAFISCKNLTSITIPNSVTSIGEHAFYSCTGLTSITIPASVTTVGKGVFINWTSAQTINVPWTSGNRPGGWHGAWSYYTPFSSGAKIVYQGK